MEDIKVQRSWFEGLVAAAKKAEADPQQWVIYLFGYIDSAKFILEKNPVQEPEEPEQPRGGALQEETKMSAKFRKKFEEKPEVKTKKGGYTEAEINNIIAMYNLGDSPKTIGKKIGKPASAISTKLWNLKREGKIKERKKAVLPPDEPREPEEPEDDGYHAF